MQPRQARSLHHNAGCRSFWLWCGHLAGETPALPTALPAKGSASVFSSSVAWIGCRKSDIS